MLFSDVKHLMYPVVLSLSVVGGLALMRAIDPVSDAMADDTIYTQQASGLPGMQNSASDGPLFNTSGINQRNAQIALLSEILSELRMTRRMLESGSVRVTVDEVSLDYGRIAEALGGEFSSTPESSAASDAGMDAGSISASRSSGSGKGSGVIRRLQDGSVVSEQSTE